MKQVKASWFQVGTVTFKEIPFGVHPLDQPPLPPLSPRLLFSFHNSVQQRLQIIESASF
jgi:hypothetical protein